MADTVVVTGDKTIEVITVGVQGPAGVSGSSVPATTTTLGGVIVGANLAVLANGLLSANAPAWADVTGKPTTLAGYGITDGLTTTAAAATYQTIAGMTGYLTTTAAALTYATISSVPLPSSTTPAVIAVTGAVGTGTTWARADHVHAIPFGTTSGTVCQGNDSRLSDPRTPTAHKTTHATGGTDAIAPADIGAQKAITSGTAAPSGGADGDIYLRYT